jgi:hypothetical protein
MQDGEGRIKGGRAEAGLRRVGVAKDRTKASKPRRTRQHVIASQSRHYVEGFIIDKGYTADRRRDDYGYDLFMETYDDDGYIENGEIRIQLKATDRLIELKRADTLCIDIDAKHHELWTNELMPVFLILYDARERRAYWLHVQHYFAADSSRRPKRGAKTLRVRIPIAHEFTDDTVDYMRNEKAKVLAGKR